MLANFADGRPRGRRHRAHRFAARMLAALPLLILLAAAACDGGAAQRSAPAADTVRGATSLRVTDDAGREVVLATPARRVISLIPAQTEVVKLLAGADALLARTQWDVDPELQHLPSIGNALSPSVEWLAAQQPDLIIAWKDVGTRDVVHRLGDIGIPVYSSSVESVADIRSMIARLGVLLDRPARAAELLRQMDGALDSVRAAVAEQPRQRVLYLLGLEQPMAAGPGTFVHELIGVAGGDNVFGDARQLWPQVSLEEVVRRDPDVIIRPTERSAEAVLRELQSRPVWRDLRAVRTGRVHAVDANLFNRAGVTVGTAAAELAGRIHGSTQAP